jgi:hypothetical protein
MLLSRFLPPAHALSCLSPARGRACGRYRTNATTLDIADTSPIAYDFSLRYVLLQDAVPDHSADNLKLLLTPGSCSTRMRRAVQTCRNFHTHVTGTETAFILFAGVIIRTF